MFLFLIFPIPITLFPPASSELLYIQQEEGETVTIYSEPQERKAQLIAFHLEHTATQTKREVIVFFGDDVTESASYAGRVQPSGSLASFPINVTISQLQHTDTGLYTSRFIYKDSTAEQVIKGRTQLFLYVKVAGVYMCCSACLSWIHYFI